MSDSPTPMAAAPPDWEVIREEILCPLCDYNLRMLVEPRCPECGYRFQWPEVLDPAMRAHPYLFDPHRPSVTRFARTVLGGVRPVRFWNAVHPSQRPRAGLLVLYWLLACLVGLLGAGAPLAFQAWLSSRYGRWGLGGGEVVPLLVAFLLLALWPWLTLLALMIFWISMRRPKVRPAHVLRCVVYSFDAILWFGVAGLLEGLARACGWDALGPAGIALPLGLFAAFRLWVAYEIYLRFHAPLATVFASQVIVVLFIPAAIVIALRITGNY